MIPCLYVVVRPVVSIFKVSILVSSDVGTKVNNGSKRNINVYTNMMTATISTEIITTCSSWTVV